jgi:acetoin:2,6-dichlorophenolindophenol oxidoreductase subunit beta
MSTDRFPVATTPAPGLHGVDWDNRVDFDRLRDYRLSRVRQQLEASDLGAILLFETSNIDVRSLVPLDTAAILGSVGRTGRLVTVEESPRLCGWGAEVASIVAEERFFDLDGPIVRITTPHIPLPAADSLEDLAIPSVNTMVEWVRETMD